MAYEPLAVAGLTYWTGHTWLIVLNAADPAHQRRFTLLHEFKHIVDHGSAALLYRGTARVRSMQQAEVAADYFAGCALVPRRELLNVWNDGTRDLSDLAQHFQVGSEVIEVRLDQTKLRAFSGAKVTSRCGRASAGTHQRRLPSPRSNRPRKDPR